MKYSDRAAVVFVSFSRLVPGIEDTKKSPPTKCLNEARKGAEGEGASGSTMITTSGAVLFTIPGLISYDGGV